YFQNTRKLTDIDINCSFCNLGKVSIKLNKFKLLLQKMNEKTNKENTCENKCGTASVHCKECKIWLCSVCLDSHNKVLKKHQLLDYEPQNTMCKMHMDEQIK